MTTDFTERSLERLICTALVGHPCDPPQDGGVAEARTVYGGGWSAGHANDYDREFCVDRVQLAAFLHATQPEAAKLLELDEDSSTRRKFLARLQGEISKRSTIDILRHGLKHGPHDLTLFYGTPSAGNVQAQERFEQNRFTVVRQLRYSRDDTQRALDLGLFINGLPVATFELKNSLTKQTVEDAVEQYKRDRDPREKLSIFLNFLVPKLPAPVEEDLSKGILEFIDMDSYRVEKKAAVRIQLADEDAEIEPLPTSSGGHRPEPELGHLSNILKTFNEQFGNIPWEDADRVRRLITEEIPAKVAEDSAYRNARENSDKQNARIEHDEALKRVMTAVFNDDMQLFKQFTDNEGFRRWLTDNVFGLTYTPPQAKNQMTVLG